MSIFYPVVTNSDYITIDQERKQVWDFMDILPTGFLTTINKRLSKPLSDFGSSNIYDCGAWAYRNDLLPPLDAASAYEKYLVSAKKGDTLVAPDHMIIPGVDTDARKHYNYTQAQAFLQLVDTTLYTPLSVVHGTNLTERLMVASELIALGYKHLAIGGVAGRHGEKKGVIGDITNIREAFPDVYIHVFGLSSWQYAQAWRSIGINSFDGTGYFIRGVLHGFWVDADMTELNIRKHQVTKPCNCKACREIPDNLRQYGNRNRNIGRGIHNVNMFLRKLNGL